MERHSGGRLPSGPNPVAMTTRSPVRAAARCKGSATRCNAFQRSAAQRSAAHDAATCPMADMVDVRDGVCATCDYVCGRAMVRKL